VDAAPAAFRPPGRGGAHHRADARSQGAETAPCRAGRRRSPALSRPTAADDLSSLLAAARALCGPPGSPPALGQDGAAAARTARAVRRRSDRGGFDSRTAARPSRDDGAAAHSRRRAHLARGRCRPRGRARAPRRPRVDQRPAGSDVGPHRARGLLQRGLEALEAAGQQVAELDGRFLLAALVFQLAPTSRSARSSGGTSSEPPTRTVRSRQRR
jgi:hypothetical protein